MNADTLSRWIRLLETVERGIEAMPREIDCNTECEECNATCGEVYVIDAPDSGDLQTVLAEMHEAWLEAIRR